MKRLILYFLSVTVVFSFEIDELKFNKEMKVGETAEKIFKLTNNNPDRTISYNLRIEGDRNVKVSPAKIVLKKFESGYYSIKATGKRKGTHHYKLIVEEGDIIPDKKEEIKKSNKTGGSITLKRRVAIEQKYKVN